MRNRVLFMMLVLSLLLVGGMTASAQLRLDATVNVPVYFGIFSEGDVIGDWNKYFLPLPEAALYYQFGQDTVRFGFGARVFSLLIENVLYPAAFVEAHFDKLVLSANVGGYLFWEFGLLSQLLADSGFGGITGVHNVLCPDINVSYAVNDWFRVGGGLYMIAPFSEGMAGLFDSFVMAGYVSAKFVVTFK